MPDAALFTVGGTVQAGGGIYLARRADDELLEHCRAGDFCYVLTARQMGKSSLMVRTAERLNAQGVRTAILDLTRLGTTLQPEQWYLGLVDELVEQLDLDLDYAAWWQKYAHLGTTQRLTRFLREVALEALAPDALVIFIDEIDTTLSLPFADDFFAAIRACYNARSTDPAYRRLAFVLLGVATPGDLIRDPQRTPFNIGQRIDLSDFTLAEALPLAEGFHLPPEEARQVLGWVLEWTGGHPYLTQRLCRALVEIPSPTPWDKARVAQAVEETFFGERSRQDGNLQFVRDMLTRRAPDVRGVLETYRKVRQGKTVLNEEQSLVISHLKISGIVRERGGQLVLRNKIYSRVFDPDWVRQTLPRAIPPRLLWATSLGLALISVLASVLALGGQINRLIYRPLDMDNYWAMIPAGAFQMGSQTGANDENPAHAVRLDIFMIGRYEVTNRQYAQCTRAGVCSKPGNERYARAEYELHPVTDVSWQDVQDFCAWVGGRLPTEAEWEKAARGGLEGNQYPWGDAEPVCMPGVDNGAQFSDCPIRDTVAVGSFKPNGYGLFDMAGNVREWVVDWYDKSYYYSSPGSNPPGPGSGQFKLLRGGGWLNNFGFLRVAYRSCDDPAARSSSVGFRCAATP